MDELELLKNDWKKDDTLKYPKLSYNEIYTMILRKSSSIVKWIFIISILEFVFWTFIAFAFKGSKSLKEFEKFDSDFVIIPLTIAGYIVLAYFFYLFYRNYRNISVTDNAKVLMENILKTRRTVRQYVAFNLVYLVIATFAGIYIQFDQNPAVINRAEMASANGEAFMFYAKLFLMTSAVLLIIIGILLLFYWLIYGILLKRLNRNYKELRKLEV